MRKILLPILGILILLAGLGILFYPIVSNWLSKYEQSYVVQTYSESVSELTPAMIEAQWQAAYAYNSSLNTPYLSDPYTQAEAESNDVYTSLLNLTGDGVMGSIQIPKIHVNLPIYHGTSTAVLDVGVGHLQGSTLPVGGEGMHSVLTGHTGMRTARLFTDLEQLEIGDEFYLSILDDILAYRVESIKVVEPQDVSALVRVEGKDLVTLVTCTPYGINSHRLLLTGSRVEYNRQEAEQKIKETASVMGREVLVTLIAVAALVLILVIRLIVIKLRKRAKMRNRS